MYQTAFWPLEVFLQRMSGLPSPLKSPTPDNFRIRITDGGDRIAFACTGYPTNLIGELAFISKAVVRIDGKVIGSSILEI